MIQFFFPLRKGKKITFVRRTKLLNQQNFKIKTVTQTYLENIFVMSRENSNSCFNYKLIYS